MGRHPEGTIFDDLLAAQVAVRVQASGLTIEVNHSRVASTLTIWQEFGEELRGLGDVVE